MFERIKAQPVEANSKQKPPTEELFQVWSALVQRHCLLGTNFESPAYFLNHPAFLAFKEAFNARIGNGVRFFEVRNLCEYPPTSA